jgi:hypothetical protein
MDDLPIHYAHLHKGDELMTSLSPRLQLALEGEIREAYLIERYGTKIGEEGTIH